jgi:cell division protein FtsL
MGSLTREWAVSMAFSIVLLLVFGLGLVWLNIERVDMAYELNKMQRQIDETEALVAKLEVERNTLITPSRLREAARLYDLGPAKPGQIRRVAPSGEVESAPLVTVNDETRSRTAAKPSTSLPAQTKTKRKP